MHTGVSSQYWVTKLVDTYTRWHHIMCHHKWYCIYHSQNQLCGLRGWASLLYQTHSHHSEWVWCTRLGMSQQETTRLVAPLAVGTSDLPPQLHGSHTVVGCSSIGLQDPWNEGGGVRPWAMASEYLSWTLGHKISHLLVYSRWLACTAQWISVKHC